MKKMCRLSSASTPMARSTSNNTTWVVVRVPNDPTNFISEKTVWRLNLCRGPCAHANVLSDLCNNCCTNDSNVSKVHSERCDFCSDSLARAEGWKELMFLDSPRLFVASSALPFQPATNTRVPPEPHQGNASD